MPVILPQGQKIGDGSPPVVWTRKIKFGGLPQSNKVSRRIFNFPAPTEICLEDIIDWKNMHLHGRGSAQGPKNPTHMSLWKRDMKNSTKQV